jgi:O-glycosyl hydrolase
MKHFSAFVLPGARRIEAGNPDALAFKNRDGSIVIVLANLTASSVPAEVKLPHRTLSVTLPANSFNTVLFK